MASVTEQLEKEKAARRNTQPAHKKNISGKGDGKWETTKAIAAYRKKRDKKNKAQRKARKANR